MWFALKKAGIAPGDRADADMERTPLLDEAQRHHTIAFGRPKESKHDRERFVKIPRPQEERFEVVSAATSTETTSSLPTNEAWCEITSSSASTSPNSPRSWQGERAPDEPRKQRSSRRPDYHTPCKSQHAAPNREPLSAVLQRLSQREDFRPKIPLNRKKTMIRPPPPRPGRFVVKGPQSQSPYQMFEYYTPRRPQYRIQSDVEAQRRGYMGDDGEAIEDDCVCECMLGAARAFLIALVVVTVMFSVMVGFMGCFGLL